MANWHYYNENREKIGIEVEVLKQLAQQGIITPETFIEDPTGRTGLAKNVKGLKFPDPVHIPRVIPPAVNVFCTNCGNTVAEQAGACLSCGARPMGYKKFCRQCGIALNPEQVICVKCGVGLTDTSNRSNTVENISPQTKTLNTYFMVFWIGIAVGMLGLIFVIFFRVSGDYLVSQGHTPGDGLVTLLGLSGMVSTLGSFAGLIFGFMLLYRLWKLMPNDIARTTPGKAVGFCFIPLFNFYWWFVAYLGLCKDMNKTLQRRRIQYRVNEGLGLIYCILAICSNILSWFSGVALVLTVIGSLFAIAVGVIGIFFFKSIKDGGVALLEHGEA